jgi:phosphoglucosamine mutase
LAKIYTPLPEAHSKVPLNGKARPSQVVLDKIRADAEAELGGAGRIVIRPSGTEPIVRIMVQHDLFATAKTLTEQLAAKISAL